MRAIVVTRFGGPEVMVVADVAEPQPEAGEVVVAAEAADTGFVETQIRRGLGRDWFPHRPPYVPGAAVAGRVRRVGDGVDASWLDRPVIAITDGYGGYAEQAVAKVEGLVPIPDGLDLRTALAMTHDGTTALGLADSTGIHAGEWVLVTAAGGGLGILLVQLAVATGARVVAAARGQHKLDLAVRLGAELAVDYSGNDWTERIRAATGGAGVDVVFDGAGGDIGLAAFAITRHGGRFSAHGAPSGGFTAIDPDEAKRRDIVARGIEQVRVEPGDVKRMAEGVTRAVSAAADGRLAPVIGQTFPLERAADAHAAIEARAVIGKTLLLV